MSLRLMWKLWTWWNPVSLCSINGRRQWANKWSSEQRAKSLCRKLQTLLYLIYNLTMEQIHRLWRHTADVEQTNEKLKASKFLSQLNLCRPSLLLSQIFPQLFLPHNKQTVKQLNAITLDGLKSVPVSSYQQQPTIKSNSVHLQAQHIQTSPLSSVNVSFISGSLCPWAVICQRR